MIKPKCTVYSVFPIKIEKFTSKILLKISKILMETRNLTGEQLKQCIVILIPKQH